MHFYLVDGGGGGGGGGLEVLPVCRYARGNISTTKVATIYVHCSSGLVTG